MDPLFRFVADSQMKEALVSFIIASLEQSIIDKAKRGEDVTGVASAINELEMVFYKLQEMYAPKQQRSETVDQAS